VKNLNKAGDGEGRFGSQAAGRQRAPEGLLILEERTQANCVATRFPSAARRASMAAWQIILYLRWHACG